MMGLFLWVRKVYQRGSDQNLHQHRNILVHIGITKYVDFGMIDRVEKYRH